MAYLVYSLTGIYPRQVKGEVRSWRSTFEALRRRRLVERRYDRTHWCWSLSARGLSVTHGWLVREHEKSLRRTRRARTI
jgi:hypothetical protein